MPTNFAEVGAIALEPNDFYRILSYGAIAWHPYVYSGRQALIWIKLMISLLQPASLIAIQEHEVGTGLGKRDRHSAAHALRASGNDGGPAGQIKQVRHGSLRLAPPSGMALRR